MNEEECVEPECENCGMLNVPLVRDCCAGCICLHCGKTAFEAGGSMNDMNWCEACEKELQTEPTSVDSLSDFGPMKSESDLGPPTTVEDAEAAMREENHCCVKGTCGA